MIFCFDEEILALCTYLGKIPQTSTKPAQKKEIPSETVGETSRSYIFQGKFG